jgi:hypothetical protein
MRLARTILAGAMLTVITSMAPAQEARTGMVTLINRLDGTISIQQLQSGTVGAAAGATEQFKLPSHLHHAVHAGDKVNFTVSETGGVKTITKIEVQ